MSLKLLYKSIFKPIIIISINFFLSFINFISVVLASASSWWLYWRTAAHWIHLRSHADLVKLFVYCFSLRGVGNGLLILIDAHYLCVLAHFLLLLNSSKILLCSSVKIWLIDRLLKEVSQGLLINRWYRLFIPLLVWIRVAPLGSLLFLIVRWLLLLLGRLRRLVA